MDPILYHAHHEMYREDLDFWADITRGRSPVLELGCGTGRVLVPLARAGRTVWGVDRALDYLRLGKGILDREPEEVRDRVNLVTAQMTQVGLRGMFGSVILPCNTFSTLSAAERSRVFGEVHRLLEPGGWFVFSVPHPSLLEMNFAVSPEPDVEARFLHPQTGRPVLVSSLVKSQGDRVLWTWRYEELSGDGVVRRTEAVAAHVKTSLQEYTQQGEAAGFQIRDLFGDFDRTSLRDDQPYLIMVLER